MVVIWSDFDRFERGIPIITEAGFWRIIMLSRKWRVEKGVKGYASVFSVPSRYH